MMRQKFIIFLLAVTTTTLISALRIDNNGVIPSVAEGQHPDIPGGKWVVDLKKFENYDQVSRLSQIALQQMDQKSDGDKGTVHFLIRVKEAARAVVAGFMHELVFYFGECQPGTKTTNNHHMAIRSPASADGTDHAWIVTPVCQENSNGMYGVCWAKVLEQEWLNNTELIEDDKPYVCKTASKTEATSV